MNTIKMKYISILCYITVAILFTSCSHQSANDHAHDDDDHLESKDEHEEKEGVHLTSKQVDAMDIQFGNLSQIKIKDFVRATGVLGLPPNALTSVNAQSAGYIRHSSKLVEGDFVKKGTILAYLENPEFIQHQQKYLELKAEITFERQELERQKELLTANAGIEKKVQQLEARVAVKVAQQKGLEKQLRYLGIDVTKLTIDNIKDKVPIYARMSGYITSVGLHNGLYATPQTVLMEIADDQHLHLELDVFEKDIARVKVGQTINYSIPAFGNRVYEGEVHVIGREFNERNKTVRVHGHLEKDRPKFIKDLFVDAKVWLNNETVKALPNKAIIRDGSSSYIYMVGEQEEDEIQFERINVIMGATDGEFTAIKFIDDLPEGKKVVIKGAYYIYAQSKSGELEHSH